MSIKDWFERIIIWLKRTFSSNNSIIQKLQDYIEQENKLKEARLKLILHKDEQILYHQFSDFYEERAVRNYVSSGHSFRIMKGWWYHMGSGHSESHGEMRKIDTGIFYITTKRIIFNGVFKNYTYNNNKLVSVEPFSDAIRIGVEGRQKTLTFTSNNPFLLGASMQLLQDNTLLEKEALEFITRELKMKIAEKITWMGGALDLNVDTYEDRALTFRLLSECIQIDIENYTPLLRKVPSEVFNFKSKLDHLSSLLDICDKELKNIKDRMGNSAKKEDLQLEFDKVVGKKLGRSVIIDALQAFGLAVNSLGIGQITLTLENKEQNG